MSERGQDVADAASPGPAVSAEREALVEEWEESAYERDCSASRLHNALEAARHIDRLRAEDVAAWKRHHAARAALAAFDAQQAHHPGREDA